MGIKQGMAGKFLLLLAISAGMTLFEAVLVYVTRTKGALPFKIKILPDFEL